MKKFLLIMCITIVLLTAMSKNQNNLSPIIPSDAIRFRIIAPSNSPADQKNKMQILHAIYPTLINSTQKAQTLEEARYLIANSQKEIAPIVEQYTKNYSINYGNNYFPEKEFLGTTYESGNYESLVIELGESKGDNWWCVLFPPLCLLEGEENDTAEVEYKSFFKEIVDDYLK